VRLIVMRTRILLILGVAATAILTGGVRAQAHSPSTFYYAPNRWAYGSDVNSRPVSSMCAAC